MKYLYRLPDGESVETVLMKYEYGYSLCVSCQVGCKMGCAFCASTKAGICAKPYSRRDVGAGLPHAS